MKKINSSILLLLTTISLFATETQDCAGMKCEDHFIGHCNNSPILGECSVSGLIGCNDEDGCSGEFAPTIRDAKCKKGDPSDRCRTKKNSVMLSSCYKICKRVQYVNLCVCGSNGETGKDCGRQFVECIKD